MKTNDGELFVVVGSSRSGKTVFTSEELKKHKRVLVWDVEAQYSGKGWQRCTTKKQLIAAINKAGKGEARIAYTGDLSEFNYFCDVAFLWGRIAPCAVVAEETSDVTSPAKAPAKWGILLRRGLKYGITIFAITQRPAESDKTAIGNATKIHLCRLTRNKDRKYMADELDIKKDHVDALTSESNVLKFIQRDMKTGETRAGLLTFSQNKPKFSFKGAIA